MATVRAVCDMQTNKLCLTLIDPTVYFDPVWVVKEQPGCMEIGDDPWLITVCYYDHEAEVELETEASIDTQPEASIDKKSDAVIDEELETPIESDHANEKDNFPEGSINSWENDYCQPSFTIQTTTPSKRKISTMEPYEYDEDYREEEIIEYPALAMEEAWVLYISHETIKETSIDGNKKTSINTHHIIKSDARAEDSTSIDRRGQPSIDEHFWVWT